MIAFRTGLSTGSSAAAAVKAASLFQITGIAPEAVEIGLLDGTRARLPVIGVRTAPGGAEAAVVKDGGDDLDVTHRLEIRARVALDPAAGPVRFCAGEGVGTVTRPGLSVPPGEPAINPGPRRMMASALREITPLGAVITVSVPGGLAIAEKTFNPRLGIVGGISILGTTGRVRPFSTPAMLEAIRCHLRVVAASGLSLILVPGAIGRRAALCAFDAREVQVVEVGNNWGEALDWVREMGIDKLRLVGHPGKLAKLAAGYFDTHSARSPSPLAGLTARAARLAGHEIPKTATVEGLFDLLPRVVAAALAEEVAARIAGAVCDRANTATAVVLVDMKGRVLGRGKWGSP